MSEAETILSSNEDEEEGDKFSRLKSLLKKIFMAYFLSEACTSRIKGCRSDIGASADARKIHMYNNYQEGINTMLMDSILSDPLFDEATMTILEEEAREEAELMFETISDTAEARGGQFLQHAEQMQMQSASASISDGDTSTSSGTSSETLEVESNNVGGHRREREAVVEAC